MIPLNENELIKKFYPYILIRLWDLICFLPDTPECEEILKGFIMFLEAENAIMNFVVHQKQPCFGDRLVEKWISEIRMKPEYKKFDPDKCEKEFKERVEEFRALFDE